MSRQDRPEAAQRRAQLEALLRRKAGGAGPRTEAEGGPIPASHGQRALCHLQSLAPQSFAYNVLFAARIRSAVDPRAMAEAFGQLVDRHGSLRTVFEQRDGEPWQVLRERPDFFQRVEAADWSEERLRDFLGREARRPFVLEEGPLFRVLLVTLAEQEHVLLFVAHHTIIDFWSYGILVEELDQVYPAVLEGRRSELPIPEATYGDFVRWQREMLAGEEGQALWRYWQRQLEGPLPVLDLFTDRPRPAERSWAGATAHFEVPEGVTSVLRRLAGEQGTTLYALLLAALQTLLHRYTGQGDLLVGSPTAGRSRPEFRLVVGYFTNMLVLRGRPRGEMRFVDFLGRTRQVVLDALEHQDLPFPVLAERLRLRPDPSRSPLFDVGFVLESPRMDARGIARLLTGQPGAETELAGLKLETLTFEENGEGLEQQEGQLDLNFHLLETGSTVTGLLPYSTDLFDAVTVERLAGHFLTLLEAIAENPEATLDQLRLISATEQQQLLGLAAPEREGYRVEEPPGTWPQALEDDAAGALLFSQAFAARVEATPERIAVETGELEWSYRELHDKASALANHLRRQGVGRGDVVGVCTGRSFEMVAAFLGILEAGAVYLPLDPTYPADRLAYMIEDSGLALVLCLASTEDCLPAETRRLVLDRAEFAAEDGSGASLPATSLRPDDLAYLIYTSGSTGRPKGVEVSHRGVVNMARQLIRRYGIHQDSRLLQSASPSFDGCVAEICKALMAGATLCLASRDELVPGPDLERTLDKRSITLATLPPSVLGALPQGSEARLPRLDTVITVGEACSAELARRWSRGRRLLNGYGPTENTVCSTISSPYGADGGTPSIGWPIGGTRAHVVDRRGQLAPVGVPGELWLGGVGLARGYHGLPARTAAVFVPDALSGGHGERLYRSGDRVRWRLDGTLDFLGRLDHQVKVRGFRIELGEIEGVLRRQPSVAECAVLAREDRPGDQRLVAYVVPRPGEQDEARLAPALREACRERLPEFMVPAAFVVLPALPLSPNGKLDRGALPAPSRPSATGATTGAALTAAGDVARRVAEVWRGVLEVEGIGLDDNFFDLGGHSLLVGRAVARLNEQLADLLATRPAGELTSVEMFRYPTVKALAAHLAAHLEPAGSIPTAAGSVASPARVADPRIAIIGMSGRFPGAGDVETFWQNLRRGVEAISRFSDEEVIATGVPAELASRPEYVKAGGALEGVEDFDAAFFGLSPREAAVLDPQQRLFLECAWEALENAGYDPGTYEGRIGVYAGVGTNTYLPGHLSHDPQIAESVSAYQLTLGNDKDFLPTRVSFKLDLKGPSVNVQTACSTSLVAVHMAVKALAAGDCDMALVGGASIRLPQKSGYLYQSGMILSPDGHCRAFDARSAGTVSGNGAGVVVLKPLERAVADGDEVVAVIRGTAINNDGGLKAGFTAPSPAGQAAVIAQALAVAGTPAASIGYVEAHGTGTELGDPIEVDALRQAFASAGEAPAPGSVALGSVKTNVGHLDAAAGVTGLIKAALAVRDGEIPPSLHFEEPNPQIDFATSPFFVNTELRGWPKHATPRRAGVSSFGIGGTNAHVVLEQPPAASRETAWQARRAHLLVLSARNEAALEASTSRLVRWLKQHPEAELADVARTLQVGRRAFGRRKALVAHDVADALTALTGEPGRVWSREATEAPGVAFLFPGQGSQYAGMAAEVYGAEPVFRHWLDRCAEGLRPALGLDLRELLFPSPEGREAANERLRRTEITQPALFAVEYSLARQWMAWGIEPQAMIGHSVGEYVAACLAEVFSLEDALALVAERGRLIGSLPGGAMLSVPLAAEDLVPRLPSGACLASVNAPGLCVVSGPAEVLDGLAAALKEDGIEARRLHVSHAFHSSAMEPILEPFRERVAATQRRAPQRRFLSNVTGDWITAEQAIDPAYWVRHLRGTVNFLDGLRRLATPGEGDAPSLWLEVGPGNTLASFARPTLAEQAESGAVKVLASLPHARDEEATSGRDRTVLLGALGRLWLAGAQVAWQAVHEGDGGRRIPLPTYPFQRQRHWVEAAAAQTASRPSQPMLERSVDPARWTYRPYWKSSVLAPLADHARQGLAEDRWILFLDPLGLGEALAGRLRALGASRVVTVEPSPESKSFERVEADHFRLLPGDRESYAELLRTVSAEPSHEEATVEATGSWRLVHLWTVPPAAAGSELGFASMVALGQALGDVSLAGPVRLEVVSSGLFRIDGRESLCPEKALLLGPARVIPQELATVSCRVLELSDGDLGSFPADRLLAELSSGDGELVAWRGGQRWLPGFDAHPLPSAAADAPPLRPGGVYLLTGGLGGMALALARQLAQVPDVRLALVSRRGLPPREGWDEVEDPALAEQIAAVRDLERAGAEVEVLAADVSDEAAMAGVFEQVRRRFGTLHGVIHAAGVAGGGALALRSREEMAAVLAPKVTGTRVLQRLLEDPAEGGKPLDFLLLCSSLGSLLGGFGTADYTAANAFLDGFARCHHRPELPVISLAWDLWNEVGMGARTAVPDALRARRQRQLALALNPEEGREVFRRVLGSGLSEVVVSTWDLEARRAGQEPASVSVLAEAPLEPAAEAAGSDAGSAGGRPELDTPFVPPSSPLEGAVAQIWQQLLGIAAVGIHDDFFDLGGHSLLGTQVLARLKESLGVELPLSVLFSHPTVATLSQEVAERQRPGAAASPESAPAASPASPPSSQIFEADLDPDLEQLSDEQVEALLAGMLIEERNE